MIENWVFWSKVAANNDFIINGTPLLKYMIFPKKDPHLRGIKLCTLFIMQNNLDVGLIDNGLFKQLQGNSYVDIGKTFLDMNDRNGIAYYKKSLRFSMDLKKFGVYLV